MSNYVIMILIGIGVLDILFHIVRRYYYIHRSLEKIDEMSGIQFERYLKYQFRRLGYRVKMTPVTGDFGADLILKKRRKKYVVQAKRYRGSVGIKAVQEAIGSMQYYKADYAVVVTNSYFTTAAEELAHANETIMWNRDDLIANFYIPGLSKEMEEANICPNCHSNLVIREGKYGVFYGCTNYPQCKYTRPIR